MDACVKKICLNWGSSYQNQSLQPIFTKRIRNNRDGRVYNKLDWRVDTLAWGCL